MNLWITVMQSIASKAVSGLNGQSLGGQSIVVDAWEKGAKLVTRDISLESM